MTQRGDEVLQCPESTFGALSRTRTCNLAVVVLRVTTAALPLSYEGKRGGFVLESSLTPTHKDALTGCPLAVQHFTT